MRHSEHTGTSAAVAVAVAGAGALGLALGLALGGCGASHPADNTSNHNYEPCVDGATRCGSAEVLERCQGGLWHPEVVCSHSAQQCVDGYCVGDNAPQLHWMRLQNGLDGYAGCTDTSVPVPEGSGFYEVTPADEQLYLYHLVWTGS